MRNRVRAAVRFGAKLSEVCYMPTGGQGRFGLPEADVMTAMLVAYGVDPARIVPETTARNTLGSVQACARLLLPGARVYAATSAYHLPRCLVLLYLIGLDVHECPPPSTSASRQWHKRWYWRLREVVALPVNVTVLLWQKWRS